jgi:hypothetical protein
MKPQSPVISERVFDVRTSTRSGNIIVRIYAPVVDEKPTIHERWVTVLEEYDSEVDGSTFDRTYGEDSFQALYLGVLTFQSRLRILKLRFGNGVTYKGETELDDGIELTLR